MDVGHYQFVETKAPKGYELDASPVNFTLDDNSSNVAVTKFDTSTPVAPHKAEQPKHLLDQQQRANQQLENSGEGFC